MSVAQEVLEVIQLLNSLTNLVQGMAPQQNQLAKEPSPFAIYTDVEVTRQALTAGIYSLPAIVQRLAEIQNALTQLGIPQQANAPVVLPTTPPPAYIAPTTSDIGDEVWNYPIPDQAGFRTLDAVQFLNSWLYTQSQSQSSLRVATYSGYRVTPGFGLAVLDIRGPTILNLDFTTIRPTDASILAWASRVYPSVVWMARGEDIVFEVDAGNEEQWWIIDLTLLQFRAWQAAATPAIPSSPPVWPGLANVALGAPVAITSAMSGLTIPGPLDGVITAIATVPVPIGYYSFDGDKSFVHLGGIAFQSDDGQDEAAQPMTFQAQVIVPRSMSRASAAKVRIQSGTTGTITPWTIT